MKTIRTKRLQTVKMTISFLSGVILTTGLLISYNCGEGNAGEGKGMSPMVEVDLPVIVGFEKSSFTYDESNPDGTVSVPLILSREIDDILFLQVSTRDTTPISAKVHEDYQFVSETITISRGEKNAEFSLTIFNDDDPEGEERFEIVLSLGENNFIPNLQITNNPAVVTIVDDDVKIISFDQQNYTFAEGVGAVMLTVDIVGVIDEEVVIAVSVHPATALEGEDYRDPASILTISANTARVTLPISLLPDNLVEIDEVFTVTLAESTPALPNDVVIQQGTTTVTIIDDDMAIVGFTGSAAPTVGEGDGSLTLTASLDKPLPHDLNIVLTYTGGSPAAATRDSDYTGVDNVIIPANSLMKTVSIPIIDDTSSEAEEKFTVTIQSISFPLNTLANSKVSIDDSKQSVEVTIIDNENTLGFTNLSLTYSEGDRDQTFEVTVRLAKPLEDSLTFMVSALEETSASAMVDVDYIGFRDRSITINARSTRATFSLTIKGDEQVEGDETLKLMLASPPGNPLPSGVEFINNPAVVTIEDNDRAVVGFTGSSAPTVGEGDSSLTLTASLDKLLPHDLNIVLTYTGGSPAAATRDNDYTGVDNVIIPANSLMKTVSIPIIDDTSSEAEEKFTVTIQSISFPLNTLANSKVSIDDSKQSVEVTIIDNENTLGFTNSSLTYSEGDRDQTFEVTVRLAKPLEDSLTFMVSALEETSASAMVDVDYIGFRDRSITINARSTRATFSLTIKGDEQVEGDETLKLMLASPPGNPLPSGVEFINNPAVVTIEDNDRAVVGFTGSSMQTVGEGDSSLTLTASLDKPLSEDLEIMLSYVAGSLPAQRNGDYNNAPDSLTIPKGVLTATGTINIVNDNIVEGNESFTIRIESVSLTALSPSVVTIGGSSRADQITVTISDNDQPAVVGFTGSSMQTVDEGDSSLTLIASLDKPLSEDLEIMLSYVAGSPSAQRNGDYNNAPDSLTIPAGDLTATGTITIMDDNIVEEDESFTIRIASVSLTALSPSVVTIGDTSRADQITVTISDNDQPAVVGFTGSSMQTVDEGDSSLTLTASLDKPLSEDLEIMLSYVAGSLPAQRNGDYNNVPDSLTIPAGDLTATGTITIVNDNIVEGNESFTIRIESVSLTALPPSVVTIGDTSRANEITVTISDNDQAVVGFTGSSAPTVGEGDSSLTLTASLDKPLSEDLEIMLSYVVKNLPAAQRSGDYNNAPDSLTISAGDLTATGTINIIDDNIVEGDESFAIRITNVSLTALPPSVVTIGDTSRADEITVTILDNDQAVVGFTNTALTYNEDPPPPNIVVILTRPLSENLTFRVEIRQESATPREDYNISLISLTIFAGETSGTLNNPIKGDQIVETNESFTLILRPFKGALPDGVSFMHQETTVTIIDSDTSTVTFLPGIIISVDEGNSGETNSISPNSSIFINSPIAIDIDLHLSVISGSADGSDYRLNNAILRIPAGTMNFVIPLSTISIFGDDVEEENEFFTLEIERIVDDLSGRIMIGSSLRVNILNDD